MLAAARIPPFLNRDDLAGLDGEIQRVRAAFDSAVPSVDSEDSEIGRQWTADESRVNGVPPG